MLVCKGTITKLIKEHRKVFQERYIKATLIETHRLQYQRGTSKTRKRNLRFITEIRGDLSHFLLCFD